MAKRQVPGQARGAGGADGRGLEGLTDAALDKRLDDILSKVKLRTGLPTEKAAQVALIEHGWEYWFKAVMRGVMRASVGTRATRELRSFERAITECGRLAEPLKKLFADLEVNGQEELEVIVDSYRQAERHTSADRVEAACQIIEQHLKSEPDSAESIVRRFGGNMGGRDAGTA